MRGLVVACLVFALVSPGAALADIYRYIDEDGVAHYTDRPTRDRNWKRIIRTPKATGRSRSPGG